MEAFGNLRQHHSVTEVDDERMEFYHILWECSAGDGVAANVMESQVLEDGGDGVEGCGDGELSHY